jgi:hypothetical protein
MALFAEAKALLRGFPRLPNGLFSHDTPAFCLLTSIFAARSRISFAPRFSDLWLSSLSNCRMGSKSMAGACAVRSFDRSIAPAAGLPRTRSTPGGCERRLVLAESATVAKRNQITAILKLPMNL